VNFDQAAKKIQKANSAQDLFGADPSRAKSVFRRLSMAVHPDHVERADLGRAKDLFATLNALWAAYSGVTPSGGFFTITTRKRGYAVSRAAVRGAVANNYPCSWMEDGAECKGVMRMPIAPRDSDLMASEAEALKALGEGDEKFRPFVPELVESFRHRDKATKMERRVNVTAWEDGFYSLREVMKAFPDGLNHRDAAWMFRRLLVALGFAHDVGYVHGAVLPQNILIHPEEHGLVLNEWCFSVPLKQTLRAWDKSMAGFYPPEAEAKEQATQATDLFMAAMTLKALVGRRAPAALRAFIRGCTLEWESMRPHSAWDLRREYDDLIERLYGPRRFRPFAMPS
jgi:hypothetical protein